MHAFSRFICCGTCRQVAHDPKACAECQKAGHAAHYCKAHRHTCVVCGQTVCEAHRTAHAAACVSAMASVEHCAVRDGRIDTSAEEYDAIDGEPVHCACAVAEDLPCAHQVTCPECEGRCGSYPPGVSHPDEFEPCWMCKGRGRVLKNQLHSEIA